jgi:hypothetical protein
MVAKDLMINAFKEDTYNFVAGAAHEVGRTIEFVAALTASLSIHHASKIGGH